MRSSTELAVLCFYPQEESEELKRRVAVLECQLRKSEAAKKGYEISTGKLLSFVEVKLFLVWIQTAKKRSDDSNRFFLFLFVSCRTLKNSCWTVADQRRASG